VDKEVSPCTFCRKGRKRQRDERKGDEEGLPSSATKQTFSSLICREPRNGQKLELQPDSEGEGEKNVKKERKKQRKRESERKKKPRRVGDYLGIRVSGDGLKRREGRESLGKL
jgi:hypothetical protein